MSAQERSALADLLANSHRVEAARASLTPRELMRLLGFVGTRRNELKPLKRRDLIRG